MGSLLVPRLTGVLPPKAQAQMYLKLLSYYQLHPLHQESTHITSTVYSILDLLALPRKERVEIHMWWGRWCAGCSTFSYVADRLSMIDRLVVYRCGVCTPEHSTYHPSGYFNPLVLIEPYLPIAVCKELELL